MTIKKALLRYKIVVGGGNKKWAHRGGVTTTPLGVPSAEFKILGIQSLESQGIAAPKFSASFRRVLS